MSKKTGVITILLGVLIFFIPSILIWSMHLDYAIVPRAENVYDYTWIPVTASIYMAKAICYTISAVALYKGMIILIDKKN